MSGSRSGFSVQISATDNASKVIDGLNKRIAAANAPVQRLQQSFGRLAQSTGIRDFNRELRDGATSAAKLFEGVNGAGIGLAALTGGLTAAGLGEAMKRASDYGTSLQLTARQAGVGVGALQKLGNAANLSGGSFQSATDSLADLNKNMQLAAHSGQGDPRFLAALAAMHVSLRDSGGKMRSSSSVMDEVLHKLAAMKDAQKQLYFGNALLGGSFQTALWPAIKDGTKALDGYLDAGSRMVNLTPQQTAALRENQKQTRRLGSDLGNLVYGAMGDFAPAVTKEVSAISDWIEHNQKAATSLTKVGLALTALAAMKPAAWLMRLLGLGAVAEVAAPVAATAALAAAPQSTPTESQAADRAFYGGLSPSQRFPSLIVPHLPTTPAGRANMDEARKYLLAHGYTPAQAAGVLANLSAESGFNPAASGDNGTSFGLAQWHKDRAATFSQWAHQNGYKITDLRKAPVSEQMAYMNWELTQGPEKDAGEALRKQTTARGAAYAFAQDYERPAGGAETYDRRARYADQFLAPPVSLAQSPPAQSVEHTVKGAATVQVHINGAPPGSRVSASTSGDMFAGAPKVVMPMPAGGGPTS